MDGQQREGPHATWTTLMRSIVACECQHTGETFTAAHKLVDRRVSPVSRVCPSGKRGPYVVACEIDIVYS